MVTFFPLFLFFLTVPFSPHFVHEEITGGQVKRAGRRGPTVSLFPCSSPPIWSEGKRGKKSDRNKLLWGEEQDLMGDFSVPFSLSLSLFTFFFLNFSHPLLQLLNSAERKLQLCWHFLSEVVKIPIAIVSNSASLAAGQVYRLANFYFSRLPRVAFLFFHSNTQRTPLSDHRATFPVDTDDLLPRYRRSNAAYFDQLYRWRATPLGGGVKFASNVMAPITNFRSTRISRRSAIRYDQIGFFSWNWSWLCSDLRLELPAAASAVEE